MDCVRRAELAQAWASFAEAIATAGAVLAAEDLGTDPIDDADKIGFLARLTHNAAATLTSGDNPSAPRFRPFGPPEVSFGIPNPDNLYQVCSVHPDHEYRICGTRNSVHFFSMGAQAPGRAAVPGGASHLGDDRLLTDDNGNFEISVSAEPKSGNWIQLQPDSRTLMVRQTFLRRESETPAELEITRVSAADVAAADATATVIRRLDRATASISTLSHFWPDWVRGFADHAGPNEFFMLDLDAHMALGGDPEVRTPLCRWSFEDGQVLLVEVTPPPCSYWNVQLATVMSEPVPAGRGVSARNGTVIDVDDDGVARLVIAAEDPGMKNWLDTGGRTHGTMTVRWVGAQHFPLPTVTALSISEAQKGTLR